jgi:very-short-patch-repair endonuclease
MPLPQVCCKCRQLKAAELGRFIKRPGRCHAEQWACDNCLSKTVPKFTRGRQRQASPLEQKAIQVLLASGRHFIQEFNLAPYWFDFAVPALRMLIEVDGYTYHHRPWQRKRDKAKDAAGQAKGWRVVRLQNNPQLPVRLETALLARAQELLQD